MNDKQYYIPVWLAILMNVNMIMGAGVFINSPFLVQYAGPFSVISYIVVALLVCPLVLSIAELAKQHSATSGGIYYYNKAQLGHRIGLFTGLAHALAKSGSIASLAFAFSIYLQNMIPFFANYSIATLSIAVLSILALINALGARLGSSVQFLFIVFKIAPIFFVALSMCVYCNPSYFSAALYPGNFSTTLPLALFGMMGFEMCCSIGHTIKDGQKNLSRVMIASFLIVATLCTLFQLGMYATLGMSLAATADPLGKFIMHLFGSNQTIVLMLRTLMNGAIMCSMIGGCFGIMYANMWNLYAIADDSGIIPLQNLGKRRNRFDVPLWYLILQWSLSATLILIGLSLVAIQKFAVFGVVVTYFLSVCALVVMYKKSKERISLPFGIVLLSFIAPLTIGYYCVRDLFLILVR